jgi:DNA polymerase III sliding clamp (beta) subunit (PCNA family)
MQIAASELKSLIKRTSTAKAEFLILMEGGCVASDSDMSVCVQSDSFKGFGTPIQVNSRKFSTVCNRLSGEITVRKTDTALTLSSVKTKVEMAFQPVKPRVFTQPEKLHTLPLTAVRDLLKYVSIAADQNKAAAQGGVVQMQTVQSVVEDEVEGLEAAGTDGKRAAWTECVLEGVDPFKFQIPLPAVAAIQNLDGDTVEIGEGENFYFVRGGATTVYANKLVKRFPNLRSFVPKEFAFTATVDAKSVAEVLHTVEPMTQENEQFAVVVHFLDGTLHIKTCGNGDFAEDETAYEGTGEFKTRVNHKLLSDFFAVVGGEVTFKANTNKTPIVLESGTRKIMIAPVMGGTE